MSRQQVINTNTRISPAATMTLVVGMMLCALAPPLIPFVLLVGWMCQRHFNQRRRMIIGDAQGRARLKLQREKILAFKSLPRVD